MLSLSPRYDLFRFLLPKDFLPVEVEEKYKKIINKNPGVIITPIDYLNESIKSITLPGIGDLTVVQNQHSSNSMKKTSNKLNVEPKREAVYKTPSNPLDNIDKEFQVNFRINQGLYNYFMLYETIFYKICKPIDYPSDDVFCVDILNEQGNPVSRIKYFDVHINGIDGLQFDYNKVERDSGEFTVTFKFNNIDFDFL